jgi:hypothetical protein
MTATFMPFIFRTHVKRQISSMQTSSIASIAVRFTVETLVTSVFVIGYFQAAVHDHPYLLRLG